VHDMKHKLVVGRRGKQKGGETPLIGTPLVGRSKKRLLAELASILAKKPDLIEWRADYFEAIADTAAVLDTAQALRAACGTRPLVFTCRSSKEGGQPITIDDEQVVELYAAVSASRLVDFVDFELENDARLVQRVRENAHANETRLILSYHNFGYTPGIDFLVDRFLEAERQGADVAMVSVMPRDRADVLTLLAATVRADEKAHIPLISMSVGPLGSVTRMVGGLFGSCLSYAVGEAASAPGQIPIGDLVAVLDILRRSRGGEMF
jgi:3-dehydroquinate dehydratase-1